MQESTDIIKYIITAGCGGVVMLTGLIVGFILGVMRSMNHDPLWKATLRRREP